MSVQLFDSIRSDNVHNILDSELSEDEGARVRDIIRAGDVRKNIYAPEGKRWQYEARTLEWGDRASEWWASKLVDGGASAPLLWTSCAGIKPGAGCLNVQQGSQKIVRRDALSSPGGAAQIVANGRNGLDVDKFDYLQRDSMYCNVRISADFDRIQKYSKVLHPSACADKVSVLCSGPSGHIHTLCCCNAGDR